jgi:hypothetical protein
MEQGDMSEFQQLGKANREIVTEGVERLRQAYQTFIHEKQAAGSDFKFIDGQMIGHNFYKLVLWHIADEMADRKDMGGGRLTPGARGSPPQRKPAAVNGGRSLPRIGRSECSGRVQEPPLDCLRMCAAGRPWLAYRRPSTPAFAGAMRVPESVGPSRRGSS